ncbi:hypothetical protein BDV26DRAFT_286342 [Aspergillus bertholletiae]|uniref:Sigma-70 region 2 family protein n=1 Tax=Aspergillus bertholletiae TaxID=1226010 RepID=A0A5N7AQ25_9EURO|nr:hypothetical protein BDV26DRAFT_286342 [Aspergillus bertholletiae]
MSNEPSSPESTKPVTEWQFIDASNNSRSNLTQVKRHVMQQYMRQKRASGQSSNDAEQMAVESHNAPRKIVRRPRKATASADDTAKKGKNKTDKGQRQKKGGSSSAQISDIKVVPNQESMDDFVEEIERDLGPGALTYTSAEDTSLPLVQLHSDPLSSYLLEKYVLGSHSSGSESSSLSPWSSTPTSPSDVALSPKTILSAARTDPFNTLPMELDAEGQRLFDFYVNEMPACSYGSHFRSAKAHNWYTAVFVPEGMKGAVAFQNTILVHAANTWAWVRNEEETDYTLVHRNRAISMLRDHMTRNPGDISDVAIIACLSAAGLEDFDPRPGHKEISWVHMRAAREMIRARGGPAAFENTRLGMLINWQDYILSGYETNGPSFFFEYNTSISRSVNGQGQWQDSVTERLNWMHASGPPMSLLSPGDDFSSSELSRPSYSRSFLSPRDEIKHQCDEFIEFLKRCEVLSISHRSNQANMPTLLFGITETPCSIAKPSSGPWSKPSLRYSPTAQTQYGRPWFAGRMLKVAKRLNLNSWMMVHDFLFSCLTLRLETSVGLWERDLRQEILSAPLTSYIMPALAK